MGVSLFHALLERKVVGLVRVQLNGLAVHPALHDFKRQRLGQLASVFVAKRRGVGLAYVVLEGVDLDAADSALVQ